MQPPVPATAPVPPASPLPMAPRRFLHSQQPRRHAGPCRGRLVDQKLRRAERLHKRNEITRAIRAQGVRGRIMVVHARANSLRYSRFAVVASRKVGNAVVRNRCKRQLRELFRTHKSALQQPADIVVRLLPPAREADFHTTQSEWLALLQRAGLVHNPNPTGPPPQSRSPAEP